MVLNLTGILQLANLFNNEIDRIRYRNNLSEQYKNIDNRLQYFLDHKEKFQILTDFLDNHDYIIEIKKSNYCIHNLSKTQLNKKLYACSSKELTSEEVEFLNSDIIQIYYDLNLDNSGVERKSPTEIRFNFISTTSYAVLFDYCKNGNCNMEYELEKMSDGTYREKNIINDEWITIYRNIPTI